MTVDAEMAEGNNRRHGVFITPFQQMFASCSGAILTSLFMTPFDVVKIRLQVQAKPLIKGECFLYCNGLMDHLCQCVNGGQPAVNTWYKKPAHYNGTRERSHERTMRKCHSPGPEITKPFESDFMHKLKFYVEAALIGIVRSEGLKSLWSGLPPTLVMAVPATVVYFTSYEHLKVVFKYRDADPRDWWKPMCSGALARVWAVSVISPIELVRTKMQSERVTYSQLKTTVVHAVKTDGVLSLWRGYIPTLLRDVPFSAIYWFGYESMKSYGLKARGATDLKFAECFIAGATSGTIAAVLTLPFDVIKTHRQIELGEQMTRASRGGRRQVTSTMAMIVRLYRQHGVQSLFTGLVPRVTKVAPACAIMISTYEYFKLFFRDTNDRKLENDKSKN